MYEHILVPISFDEERDAAGAIDIAKALRSDSGEITLLHAMEDIPSYAISYLPDGFRAQTQEAIEKELQEMAQSLPNTAGVVVQGHSSRSILDYASENGVDCIVIASHRPGMQDLFLGSTAARVVRHANCAVHVLR